MKKKGYVFVCVYVFLLSSKELASQLPLSQDVEEMDLEQDEAAPAAAATATPAVAAVVTPKQGKRLVIDPQKLQDAKTLLLQAIAKQQE